MSERSDEVTKDASGQGGEPNSGNGRTSKSTDELLAETERLLEDVSGEPPASGSNSHAQSAADTGSTTDAGTPADTDTESESWFDFSMGRDSSKGDSSPATDERTTVDSDRDSSSGRLSSLRRRLSPGQYLSPKALLAVLLTLTAGMLVGGAVLPFSGIGRVLGLALAAFTVGLVTSKRRYLELSAAGVGVGVLGALLDFGILLPTDAGQTVLAIGAGAGLLASVVGYYFGRDLRDGLSRDIE
ncbi:DUF456 domain-containing protein [Halobacteria archaeon AArc-curdl1]|uniref:DUF456 domain-containing protein n=1 Tax=Natronosalvus hydrolyticus TaxID=2979988 RepID=A0AAP3E6B5_9EURY|nr:DUF456 domain-containing protein [Halobacteria archaeon AArc-curdl1]